MKTNILIVCQTLLIFLSSCSTNISSKLNLQNSSCIKITRDNVVTIDISKSKKVNTDEFLARVDSIDYVLLGFTHAIGEITRLEVTTQNIFILDAFITHTLSVFNKHGDLAFVIDNFGRGPNEYLSIWDFYIDNQNQEIIIDDADSRMHVHYSLADGHFIRKTPSIQNTYFSNLNGRSINIVNYGQSLNNDENWNVIVSKNDSTLYKGFEYEPIQEGDYIVNSFTFDNDGALLYTPTYSDTIYCFSSDSTAFAKYVIKQPKSIWSMKDEQLSFYQIQNLIKNNNFTNFAGKFLQTDKWSNFIIKTSINNRLGLAPYFYNESTNEIFHWTPTNPSIVREFIPTNILAVSHNRFYSLIPCLGVENVKKTNLNKKLIQLLNNIDNEYGYILVSYIIN